MAHWSCLAINCKISHQEVWSEWQSCLIYNAFYCVCVFRMHISLCLSAWICMCAAGCLRLCYSSGKGKKRKVAKIRTICAVFTTCNKVPHSNQSQVSKVIYYPILCLVFAQWLREKQRDTATATDNMLINWDCTTMPPRRDEALKWLPPERRITAPSCSPFMLKKKKDVHFVWATNYICSGRIFSKRGFYSLGASIVAVNRKDSKIVSWMWSEAMLVFMPALCPVGPFFFSKTPHTHMHTSLVYPRCTQTHTLSTMAAWIWCYTRGWCIHTVHPCIH